jgi:hypothetical protein
VLVAHVAHLSVFSRGSSCRYYPRQEPGAVIPLAGIRAGGGGRLPFLARQPLSRGVEVAFPEGLMSPLHSFHLFDSAAEHCQHG